MYVPAPEKPLVRRLARFAGWKSGDAVASVLSAVSGFRVPDEPLQPFAQKLPMLLGVYEKRTAEELRKLVRPGMVVIDGGAHVGYMTRLLSKLVGPSGRVFAFEMNQRTLPLLRHNTRHLANVEIIPSALGATNKTVPIYRSRLSAASSVTASKPGLKRTAMVQMESIQSAMRRFGDAKPDLIKLDIEGGEPEVIRSFPDLPVAIIFEVKRYIMEAAGESPESFLAELSDKGFSVRIIDGDMNKANVLAIRA